MGRVTLLGVLRFWGGLRFRGVLRLGVIRLGRVTHLFQKQVSHPVALLRHAKVSALENGGVPIRKFEHGVVDMREAVKQESKTLPDGVERRHTFGHIPVIAVGGDVLQDLQQSLVAEAPGTQVTRERFYA